MLRRGFIVIAGILAVIAQPVRGRDCPRSTDDGYFLAPDTLSDPATARAYSAYLWHIEEPSLSCAPTRFLARYRFTFLGRKRQCARIDVSKHGTRLEIVNGDPSFLEGTTIERSSRQLSAASMAEFRRLWVRARVWNVPRSDPKDRHVEDGFHVLIESRVGDRYGAIVRDTPEGEIGDLVGAVRKLAEGDELRPPALSDSRSL